MMVRWLLGMKNNHSKSGTSTLRLLTTILHSDGDLTEQGKIRYINCRYYRKDRHFMKSFELPLLVEGILSFLSSDMHTEWPMRTRVKRQDTFVLAKQVAGMKANH